MQCTLHGGIYVIAGPVGDNSAAQGGQVFGEVYTKSGLASYQNSGVAPEEQASDSKVSRRVAFEDNVDVDMVALTSGAARLVKGFITREQHSTLRSLLNLEPGENCFGKDGHCPL